MSHSDAARCGARDHPEPAKIDVTGDEIGRCFQKCPQVLRQHVGVKTFRRTPVFRPSTQMSTCRFSDILGIRDEVATISEREHVLKVDGEIIGVSKTQFDALFHKHFLDRKFDEAFNAGQESMKAGT